MYFTFFEVALPKAYDFPASLSQFLCDRLVPCFVAFDLLLPVLGIIGRDDVAAIVTVPETAVGKKRNPFVRKNKIGMTREAIISAPALDALGSENLDQPALRGLIPLRFDSPHDRRALFLGECVGHLYGLPNAVPQSSLCVFWSDKTIS